MAEMGPPSVASPAVYRRYLLLVLGPVLALTVCLGAIGFWSQPPTGDLTRIGGLSERAFGWTGRKQGFTQDYFRQITFDALLKGAPPGDILVFGDSFSFASPGHITWTNTLHEQTGLSVTFVPTVLTDVVRYLDSEAFRATPPTSAIIVEAVEREAITRALDVHDPARPCGGVPVRQVPDPVGLSLVTLPKQDISRRLAFDSVDEVFSWGALRARLWFETTSDAVVVALDRATLFSNQAQGKMLIYSHDLTRQQADAFPGQSPDAVAADAICGLRQMFARADGVPMRFTIAPNKRSVYDPWITTALPARWIDAFAVAKAALGASYVDLLTPLVAAAETTEDIYYPNDTHWGAAGHRVAGLVLADSLR